MLLRFISGTTHSCLLLLALYSQPTRALLAAPALLSKALSSGGRPLIVHIWDPNSASVESFAIDDVSEACRTAGAAAVLCDLDLVAPIAKEQESARGEFPGSLPVLTDVALLDLIGEDGPQELFRRAKSLGASGIGIRYYGVDWQAASALEDMLQHTVAAANQIGLGAILLPEFGTNGDEGVVGGGRLSLHVGAAAGLAKSPEAGGEGENLAFGCWDGEPDALQRLRDEGFKGLLLKNACRGDLAWGSKTKQPSLAAMQLTRLVKASQSKGSTAVWGGAGISRAAPVAGRARQHTPAETWRSPLSSAPKWARQHGRLSQRTDSSVSLPKVNEQEQLAVKLTPSKTQGRRSTHPARPRSRDQGAGAAHLQQLRAHVPLTLTRHRGHRSQRSAESPVPDPGRICAIRQYYCTICVTALRLFDSVPWT